MLNANILSPYIKLKLLLKKPSKLSLTLRRDDEQEWEEQQKKKKDQVGILKFAVARFPLGSLISTRMKEMQEERMINYGL